MRSLTLFSYIVLLAILPILANAAYEQKQFGVYLPFISFVEVSIICGSCIVMSLLRGKLVGSLRLVLLPERRWMFAASILLATGSFSFDYLFDYLEIQTRDNSPSPVTRAIDRTMLETVSIIMVAWVVTALFERRRAPATAKATANSAMPQGSGGLRRMIWESLCTALALAAMLAFLVHIRGPESLTFTSALAFLRRPDIPITLLWVVFQVATMQIARAGFSRQGIDVASFMAWRMLIPTAVAGGLLLVKLKSGARLPHLFGKDADATPVLIAVAAGVSLTLSNWFQYESLADFTVVSLARVAAVIPLLTYLVFSAIANDAPSRDLVLPCVGVAACFLAAEVPWSWVRGTRTSWEPLALWRRLGSDPVAYIGTRIFGVCLFSGGLAVALFLPVLQKKILPHLNESGQFWLLLVIIPMTALVLCLGLLSRMVGHLVQYRMKTVGLVAHEMRAPFKVTQRLMTQLNYGDIDPEQFEKEKKDIRDRCELGERLVICLLDEVKADQPLALGHRSTRDVKNFMAETFATLRRTRLIGDARLELNSDRVGADSSFDIDSDRMFLVLFNLMSNSITVWRAEIGSEDTSGLEMCWEAETTPGWFVLSVTDNGPGMGARLANTAMEAWVSASPGGTGLGLFLCRKYVEAHEGRMTIENRPKRGCKVTVRLPLAHASPAANQLHQERLL